jgi:hypothetical protein
MKVEQCTDGTWRVLDLDDVVILRSARNLKSLKCLKRLPKSDLWRRRRVKIQNSNTATFLAATR